MTAPGYILKGIPNNKAGRAFITTLRKHINRAAFSRVRVRGNGPRVLPAWQDGRSRTGYFQDLPVERAKTLRVYLDTRRAA